MKKSFSPRYILFLLFIFLFNINVSSQTLLSQTQNREPYDLKIIENKMYYSADNNIYRFSLHNPSNIERVTSSPYIDNEAQQIAYNPDNNSLYCYFKVTSNLAFDASHFIGVIDLDLDLPITPVIINPTIGTQSCGITINNNTLYNAAENKLYALDLDTENYSVIYTSPDKIGSPVFYNNEIYFGELSFMPSIYKINPNLSTPNRTLVSNINTPSGDFNELRSSLVVDEYLYLGYEANSKIIRLNLTESNLPVNADIFIEFAPPGNIGYPVYGLENKNSTIYFSGGVHYRGIYQINDQTLGVEMLNSTSDNEYIYPNPAKKNITLESNFNYNRYLIYSISGEILINEKYNNDINIQNLTNGLYFILFKSDKVIRIFKFIKN